MTEPHKRARRHPKYKRAYPVRNGSVYDRVLRDRGDVTLWISEAAITAWQSPPGGRRGGQQKYSDIAIQTDRKNKRHFPHPPPLYHRTHGRCSATDFPQDPQHHCSASSQSGQRCSCGQVRMCPQERCDVSGRKPNGSQAAHVPWRWRAETDALAHWMHQPLRQAGRDGSTGGSHDGRLPPPATECQRYGVVYGLSHE